MLLKQLEDAEDMGKKESFDKDQRLEKAELIIKKLNLECEQAVRDLQEECDKRTEMEVKITNMDVEMDDYKHELESYEKMR